MGNKKQTTKHKKRMRAPRPSGSEGGLGFFQIVMLIIIGAIVILGIFWVIEEFGSQHAAFVKAFTRILGSIATVFTTYFLINRAMRLREKESDGIIISFVGYIDYLVQTYHNSYIEGPEDDEESMRILEDIEGLTWQELEDYAEKMKVNAHNLPYFLLDTVDWPSYLNTAEEKLKEVYDATQQITALLGVSSPKMAVASMEVVDAYSDLFRDDLPVITRGLRGYRKLEWIAKYGKLIKDKNYLEELQEDIDESLGAILEAMQYIFQKVPVELEEELRGKLDTFYKKLSKRQKEIYDRELQDVGETFDID